MLPHELPGNEKIRAISQFQLYLASKDRSDLEANVADGPGRVELMLEKLSSMYEPIKKAPDWRFSHKVLRT